MLKSVFYSTQIIYIILRSMITANHHKGEGFPVNANGEFLKKEFDTLFHNLYCIQNIEYDLCLTDPT